MKLPSSLLPLARRSLSSYRAPVAAGVNPAYDTALAYIRDNTATHLAKLEAMKAEGRSAEECEAMEVTAWVNDPEVRALAKAGKGDLSKPVYRHLAERSFRKDGRLALLLQRVTQMSLTPDILSEFNPVLDLKLTVEGTEVVPGEFLLPDSTRTEVQVEAVVFHAEERLYTLMMIDPDVPDELNHTFTTFAHWIVPNIPLSATSTLIQPLPTALSYLPPHPQQGTPYHRYTFILFAQSGTTPLDIAISPEDREGLNVRDFVKQHGLQPEGINFFRQVWDRSVRQIYSDYLDAPEPKFGRAPKVNRYIDEDGKRARKYELE